MPSRIASTDCEVERSTSVSSIRSTKVPFILRANAHGYSAERMLPRWIKPVGLGAKRVRTEVVINGHSEDGRRRAAMKRQQARQRNASMWQQAPVMEANGKCESRIIPADGLLPGRAPKLFAALMRPLRTALTRTPANLR